MNLPEPMASNTSEKIVNKLIVATNYVAETTMQDPCNELRADSTSIMATTVSCDGLWQRRVHSSLNCVVTLRIPMMEWKRITHFKNSSNMQSLFIQRNIQMK